MKLIRCIRFLNRLSTPDFDDEPARPHWITNDWQAALIDPDGGRVLAHVWDDECGKYYPTLFLSPLQAIRVNDRWPTAHCRVVSFTRVEIDLLRLKANSMRDAQDAIEAVLNNC